MGIGPHSYGFCAHCGAPDATEHALSSSPFGERQVPGDPQTLKLFPRPPIPLCADGLRALVTHGFIPGWCDVCRRWAAAPGPCPQCGGEALAPTACNLYDPNERPVW